MESRYWSSLAVNAKPGRSPEADDEEYEPIADSLPSFTSLSNADDDN